MIEVLFNGSRRSPKAGEHDSQCRFGKFGHPLLAPSPATRCFTRHGVQQLPGARVIDFHHQMQSITTGGLVAQTAVVGDFANAGKLFCRSCEMQMEQYAGFRAAAKQCRIGSPTIAVKPLRGDALQKPIEMAAQTRIRVGIGSGNERWRNLDLGSFR